MIREIKEEFQNWENEALQLLCDYLHLLRRNIEEKKPNNINDEFDDSYVEAIGENRQLGKLVRQRAIDKVKYNSISGRIDLNEFYNVYQQTLIEFARENPNPIQQVMAGLRYEAVLNVNQDKVYNIDTK